MSTRRVALVLVAAGILLGLLSLHADLLGLGQGQGFGTAQVAGVGIGTVLLIAGLIVRRRAAAARSQPQEPSA